MKIQTDNSYLSEKVQLRIESLPKKDVVYVLECFAGDGLIWKEVKRITKRNIKILRIDQKEDKKGIYLKGDNLKFLQSMDLSRFDVVDLDAYGECFRQMEIIFAKKFSGIVHVTYTKHNMARINYTLLTSLGYSRKMIDKAPTLFAKNLETVLEQYLAKKGIKKITGYFFNQSHFGKKMYFYFKMIN